MLISEWCLQADCCTRDRGENAEESSEEEQVAGGETSELEISPRFTHASPQDY